MKVFFSIVTVFVMIAICAPINAWAQIQTVNGTAQSEAEGNEKGDVAQQQESKSDAFLRLRPWRGDNLLLEAERLILQGQCAEAIPVLDKILNRNLKTIDAHVYKAHCHLLLNNLKDAEDALRLAYRIDTRHLGVHYYMAKKELLEGKLSRAKDELKALSEICRGDVSECQEYQTLEKEILEYNTEQSRANRERLRNRDVSY